VGGEFKWRHFAGEVILLCVRWYCRYGISYRDLEEMMGERGGAGEHSATRRCCGTFEGSCFDAQMRLPSLSMVLLARGILDNVSAH